MNNKNRNLHSLLETAQDSSLEGYQIPQTCHYLSYDYSFPRAQRDLKISNTSLSPDGGGPASYSETLEVSQKRFWASPSGTFPKALKQTLITSMLKKTQSFPGPGQYSIPDKTVKGPKAVFGKDRKPRLFDNTEALSQTVPSSYKYRPHAEVRRLKNGLYHKPYSKPDPEKLFTKTVGPGSYNPDLSLDKRVLKSTIFFKQAKAERLVKKSQSLKKLSLSQIPPVGTYELLNDSLTMVGGLKKKISGISPYMVPRQTEIEIRMKKGIPGPGAYNVGPLPKIYKENEKLVFFENKSRKKYVKEV